MINWKKISKPVLMTVLSASAFYGGSAIGYSRPDISQELSMDTTDEVMLVGTACDDAKASTDAAEEALQAALDNAEAVLKIATSAAENLTALQNRTPPATPGEIAGATAAAVGAIAVSDAAVKSANAAKAALTAAQKAEESACSSGPRLLPPARIPERNPTIPAMDAPEEETNGDFQ